MLLRKTLTGQRKRERAEDHPLFDLLHSEPNKDDTSFEWREMVQANVLMRGGGYSQIIRNFGGKIVELIPLETPRMRVVRQGGRKRYFYRTDSGEVEIKARDVFQINGFRDGGVMGLTPLDVNRDALGTAYALDRYAGKYFAEGGVGAGGE